MTSDCSRSVIGVHVVRQGLATLASMLVLLPAVAAWAETIPTGTNPVAVAVNVVTNKTYIANQGSGTVTVVNGATRTTQTVGVGSGPVALAVNDVTNRIFVANTTDNTVTVIDGSSDVVVAIIPLAANAVPLAIAVDPVTNRIYVANSGADTVTVVDGSNNVVTATVGVGTAPSAVAVNPVTGKIYVANATAGSVTVINGADNSSVDVAVGTTPTTLAVNPVTNKIYVVNSGGLNLSVINGATNTSTPIALASAPTSLAINPVTNRIYVSRTGTLTVVEGVGDTVVTSIVVGAGQNQVGVNPLTNQVFVGNQGASSISFINGATNTLLVTRANGVPAVAPYALGVNPVTNVILTANRDAATSTWVDVNAELLFSTAPTTVGTGTNPRAVAVNPVTNKTYVANADSTSVTVVNGATNGTSTVVVGANPTAIAVNSLTDKIYVANRDASSVTVINGPDNATTTLSVGTNPSAIQVNTITNRIYVTNEATNTVSVIDGAANPNVVIATVAVGTSPAALTVNDVTNMIYVANAGSDSVSAIHGITHAVTTIPVSVLPRDIAANPETNTIYVVNRGADSVTIIDGGSNATTTVAVGNAPSFVAVNRRTNTIYVANTGTAHSLSVISGTTGTVTSTWPLAFGETPTAIAVNPVRNAIYVATSGPNFYEFLGTAAGGGTAIAGGAFRSPNGGANQVGVAVNPFTNKAYLTFTSGVQVFAEQPDPPTALVTSVTPLSGNKAFTPTPTFTFTATSNFSPTTTPIQSVFYQTDTWSGVWSRATSSGGAWTGQTGTLKPGVHIVYAFAGDGQEAPYDKVSDGSSPVIGSITAYLFVVGVPPTVTSVAPPSGPSSGGTPITIAGSNFGTGATVTIGGAAATGVNVVSSTSITAVTPAGSLGAKDVVVANPVGASGTLTAAFTYTCGYAISPTSASLGASAGTGSVAVTAEPGCAWTVVSNSSFITVTSGSIGSGNGTVTYSVSANTGNQVRSGTLTIAGQSFTLTQTAKPTLALTPAVLNFGAVTRGGGTLVFATPSQALTLAQTAPGTVTWTAAASQPWITLSPTSGSGPATISVSINSAGGVPPPGALSAFITITATGATNNPVAPINLKVFLDGTTTGPVGSFDTPTDGLSGAAGSIAVTGWTMDEIGVSRVRILRDPVAGEGLAQIFIGNAVRVTGARPDVASLFPTTPLNESAGWGYLMLTNFLPNQGTGTFRLYAYADDVEGGSTLLGTKTITCTNNTATKPFGAIDTPDQGATVNGIVNNFGWVLTRGPARADPPFGTVSVLLDGVLGVSPGGWTSRSDLTALFSASTYPGVTNAAGVAGLDTTTLSNGVHTIAWIVTATDGQTEGVGSRYFTVSNGVSGLNAAFNDAASAQTSQRTALSPSVVLDASPVSDVSPLLRPDEVNAVNAAPLDREGVAGRPGYDLTSPLRTYESDAEGRTVIAGEELDRFEVRLWEGENQEYTGHLRVGNDLSPLPIGSHLDRSTGTFAWQPSVGFVGTYDFVFIRWSGGLAVARREIRIVLNPQGSGSGPRVVIDTPVAQAEVGPTFALTGSAFDDKASTGTGVAAIHVWAYPAGGGAPRFVGATAEFGERPDVAAIYGRQFLRSGYGLVLQGLEPGTYDLAVFAWSASTSEFAPARTVRVTVR